MQGVSSRVRTFASVLVIAVVIGTPVVTRADDGHPQPPIGGLTAACPTAPSMWGALLAVVLDGHILPPIG